jgi:hypothetical protein
VSVPVLWQFRYSHYNEKVRWALDFKRIAHERRSLLPGLHIPRVVWMTGQKAVPVLVIDGRSIADSTFVQPLPEKAAEFRNSVAQRRGFRWVLDIYRQHRGESAAVRE